MLSQIFSALASTKFFAGRYPTRARCLQGVAVCATPQTLELRQMKSAATPTAENADVELKVTTPSLFHYGDIVQCVVSIANQGDTAEEVEIYLTIPQGAYLVPSQTFETWNQDSPNVISWKPGDIIDGQRTTTVVALAIIDQRQTILPILGSVDPSTNDNYLQNNVSLATMELSKDADVSIAVNGSSQAFAGSNTPRDFTLVVTNYGPFRAFDVQVSAYLDQEIKIDWSKLGPGFYTDSIGVLQKDIGSLESGQSETVTIPFTIPEGVEPGFYDAYFTAWSNVNPDPLSENNYGKIAVNTLPL